MTLSKNTLTARLTSALALIVTVSLFAIAPAAAQDYKEAYNSALEAANAKDYQLALDKFNEAADGAQAEGDEDVERRARKVIAQLRYNFGLAEIKNENYEAAIAHFEDGIEQYPTNAKNYLARGTALKKMDRIDDAIAAYAEAMQVGNANGDSQTARKAEDQIRQQYIYMASSALNRTGNTPTRSAAEEALGHLDTLENFVKADSDVLYYRAEANKALGNLEEAVALADQALEMHRGSNTDKAKIYFVKGEALMQAGDITAAKAAFQNATYGSYRAPAQHYIETLGTN